MLLRYVSCVILTLVLTVAIGAEEADEQQVRAEQNKAQQDRSSRGLATVHFIVPENYHGPIILRYHGVDPIGDTKDNLYYVISINDHGEGTVINDPWNGKRRSGLYQASDETGKDRSAELHVIGGYGKTNRVYRPYFFGVFYLGSKENSELYKQWLEHALVLSSELQEKHANLEPEKKQAVVGNFTKEENEYLRTVLRAGSLELDSRVISEATIAGSQVDESD